MNAATTRTENEMTGADTKAMWALSKALKYIALMDIKIDTQGIEGAASELKVIRENRLAAQHERATR
tara:strand:+ start:233 stop:433 length:201 start_codon:yes stop_codon:yes gene_type:complete